MVSFTGEFTSILTNITSKFTSETDLNQVRGGHGGAYPLYRCQLPDCMSPRFLASKRSQTGSGNAKALGLPTETYETYETMETLRLSWENSILDIPIATNPVSFTSKFTSILTNMTSKFADNHRIDCM